MVNQGLRYMVASSYRYRRAAWVAAMVAGLLPAWTAVVRADDCARLLPLAPSLTEVAYQLDLGRQVVGRVRYAEYPPEAKSQPSVGGFLDPHLEAIVALRPSLVLALNESRSRLSVLERLSIPVLYFEHRSVEGILQSLTELGARCERSAQAQLRRQRIEEVLQHIRGRTGTLSRPRVMVVIGGELFGEQLRNIFVSGRDGIFRQIIELAGGTNVMEGMTVQLPGVSIEGLYQLNPDVIIHVTAGLDDVLSERESFQRAWGRMSLLAAVKNHRVHILSDDFVTIPGPRIDEMASLFATLIHPVTVEGDAT